MTNRNGRYFKNFFKGSSNAIICAMAAAALIVMIIPIPTILLDNLMILNLILAFFILLAALYTRKAANFSSFPTVLLVFTIFGLWINVSFTRLILTMGEKFDGKLIRGFSRFAAGSGSIEGLVAGFVTLIVFTAIHLVVITKGATRIAEVSARFTLDALPGKQMAIEAEYNSGAITEEESITRKNGLQREVDFYFAMDGASKFISGSVKVEILITAINILGGIIIGMAIDGEAIGIVLGSYTSFAIGSGFLTQFPAILLSIAAGIFVTRSVKIPAPGEK